MISTAESVESSADLGQDQSAPKTLEPQTCDQRTSAICRTWGCHCSLSQTRGLTKIQMAGMWKVKIQKGEVRPGGNGLLLHCGSMVDVAGLRAEIRRL